MNWLQKIAQDWGREELPQMIEYAFRAYGNDHPAGEFERFEPTTLPSEDYLFFRSNLYTLMLYVPPPSGLVDFPTHGPVVPVNFKIKRNNTGDMINHWTDFSPDDLRQIPQNIVEITYRLIDSKHHGDDDDNRNDPPDEPDLFPEWPYSEEEFKGSEEESMALVPARTRIRGGLL